MKKICLSSCPQKIAFAKKTMRTYTVGEFKSQFSEILEIVKLGENVAIAFGKQKEIVAYLVPRAARAGKKRPIGLLDGKANAVFSDDFKMTELEFLGA